ncbi:PASTA domain-containing protein [Candidatus Dependentiae bacterium]|nr:PASTA domain-containing protein [Candidatus Dependentiae bacterium]
MKTSRKQYFFRSSNGCSRLSSLWLLPFIGFVIGYVIAGYFVQKKDVATPNVIGKSLAQSIQILSQERLGVRLLTQREEPTLPESTVLDQLPRPGQHMRPNQTVFVTISTKQPPQETPDWWGKRIKDITPLLDKRGLQYNIIQLQSTYPQGMCIAQVPTAGQPLVVKTVTLFISLGSSALAVMPDFQGLTVAAFEKLLEQKDIRVEYLHEKRVDEQHRCDECVIIGQQPVVGAMVVTNKTIDLQMLLRAPVLSAMQIDPVERIESPLPAATTEGLLDEAETVHPEQRLTDILADSVFESELPISE